MRRTHSDADAQHAPAGDYFHVDAQFLRNALGVFEDIRRFEETARSRDPAERAGNVSTLVDALDLCNMLVLGDRIVFDAAVGGGREQVLWDKIDAVATKLADGAAADAFRASFAGVSPSDEGASLSLEREAAKNATAFFPRLARCATNILDLFHLPRQTPTDPARYLIRWLDAKRQPTDVDIEEIQSSKEITGRRFYAALLSNETAFHALCDARQRLDLTDDVVAVLFTNFRLRLAEGRSLTKEKVIVAGGGDGLAQHTDALVYLPSMGRRDFSREFSRFVRYGRDDKTRNSHAFDVGLREYVVEDWDGVGCQIQLSERRAIPLIVASVLGSIGEDSVRRPETLLTECLRWRSENVETIAAIRAATEVFEALDDAERKEKAAAYVAEILRSPSTQAASNRALGEKLSIMDQWFGLAIRAGFNLPGTLADLALDKVDEWRLHLERTSSAEYKAATHLSEAARPLLAGASSEVRQCMVDIFGGTVLDARNRNYDPDNFPAMA